MPAGAWAGADPLPRAGAGQAPRYHPDWCIATVFRPMGAAPPASSSPRPSSGASPSEDRRPSRRKCRRDRRHGGDLVPAFEVRRDRVRARVDAEVRELLAERHDIVLERPWGATRAPVRPPGPRLEPGLTLGVEAPAELVDPPRRDAVGPAHLRLRPSLDPDRRDHQPRQRHRPTPRDEVGTMSRDRPELSPENRHCRGRP
jgi:hypothetical protein